MNLINATCANKLKPFWNPLSKMMPAFLRPSVIAGVLLFASGITHAQAPVNSDKMDADYRYPDSETVVGGPFSFVDSAETEVPHLISNPNISLSISNETVTIFGWNLSGSLSGPSHGDVDSHNHPVTFNGLTFADATRAITGVLINGKSTMQGLDNNRVKVASGRVYVNLMDLSYNPQTQIVLDLTRQSVTNNSFSASIAKAAGNNVKISISSSNDSYLWLHAYSSVGGMSRPLTALLAQNGSTAFAVSANAAREQYFTISKYPLTSTVSQLNDGIPDGWKLQHSLDPLAPNAGSQIVPGQNITWLQFYQSESDDSPSSDLGRLKTLILSIPKISVPETTDVILGSASLGFSGEWSSRVEVLSESHQLTQKLERLIAFNPNADSLFPGSIVQGKDLPNGIITSINTARQPLTITVTDLNVPQGTKLSETINDPRLSTITAAISDIVGGAINTEQPAKISFQQEYVNSIDEAMLKLGASVSWMSGSVSGAFHLQNNSASSRYMVRVVQAYYTVSCEPPASPVAFFAHGVRYDDVTNYISQNNPPAYVASVTYGRELWMLIESATDAKTMSATLNAAFNGVTVSGELDVSASEKSILEQSSIQIMALGGSGQAAVALINGNKTDSLRDYLKQGANFSKESPGAIISYTVRYLQDNDLARVSSSADYSVVTQRPSPQRALLTRATITLTTAKDGDDKDDDTWVGVGLFTSTVLAASTAGQPGKFENNSVHAYDLQLSGQHYRDEFTLGKVTIDIAPNGNDTWDFSSSITLYFEDQPGTPVIHPGPTMRLSQNARHGEWFWP